MNIKIIGFSIVIMFFFKLVICQYSELSYEQLRTTTLINTESEWDCSFDMVYDHYGINYCGLDVGNNRSLYYYLIDNNGQVLEMQNNFENNFKSVCIKSDKGKVYIIAQKGSEIVIYQKINGVSQMSLLARFTPQNYTEGSDNNSIDATFFNDNLYICWFGSVYPLPEYPQLRYGAVGFVKFDPISLAVTSYEPINKRNLLVDHNYYGHSVKMISSTDKIHIIFSYPGMNNDTLFINRDISFIGNTPIYENWKGIVNWGTGLYGGTYVFEYDVKASIACTGDKLLLSANLLYQSGYIYFDNKFKYKNINDEWNSNYYTLQQNSGNFKNNPPVSFNSSYQKGILGYTINNNNGYYNAYQRQFANNNPNLEPPVSLGSSYGVNYAGGFSSSCIQGDCFLYKGHTNNVCYDYILFRRPNYIFGNIIFNSIFSGNEYIGRPDNLICHSAGANIIANPGSVTNILENTQFTIDQGNTIEFNSGAILNIKDNAQLIIDGSDALLKINPNVNVYLGSNAKILIKNGGRANITGATFAGIFGNNWQGIEFIDASSSTISDCSFQNAVLPIKISNNQLSATYSITNNVFNLPSGGTYGIFASNIFSLNLQNNTFNLTNSANGVRINNYYFTIPPGDDDEPNYLINNNTFNGGYVDLMLANFTSSLIHYEIINNKFYNNNYISILGRMISGNVKNNKGNAGSCQRAFHFTQSNINLYGNTDFYANNGLYAGAATINLAPTTSEAGMLWLAGKNHIYSNQNDVLSFSNTSIALKDGENFIFKPAGNSYHLYGPIFLNGAGNLSARNNCFNQSQSPNSFLWDENYNTIIPNTAGSTINCLNTTDAGIGWIVRDLGFEIYDSVKITSLPSGTQLTNEEMLYSQIVSDFNAGSYFNASAGIKSFINQYPSSNNIYSSLYDLYTCYEGLDTNPSQSSRNILYGNLLTYLNDKINSGLYDDNFNSIAYGLTLCCYANITEYNSALDGYEFISLYHPNPEVRILASWDYAEVQALLNSGAGLTSRNEKMTEAQFLKERVRKMEKLIMEDPVKNKVKKSYLKLTKEKEKTMEAALNKFAKTDVKNKMQDMRKEETNLKNKAVSNLKNGITYTKEEREIKQLEDLILISGLKSIENRRSSIDDNTIPGNYELSQNYPNPFNPVTSIKYSIPKDGLITLKIYDITGREVETLVNEVKRAGYYTIQFNASRLSSGIYFYRISAGDFVQTKKMVLIK